MEDRIHQRDNLVAHPVDGPWGGLGDDGVEALLQVVDGGGPEGDQVLVGCLLDQLVKAGEVDLGPGGWGVFDSWLLNYCLFSEETA